MQMMIGANEQASNRQRRDDTRYLLEAATGEAICPLGHWLRQKNNQEKNVNNNNERHIYVPACVFDKFSI